jgi:L-threonylcarbamoyladenylate synthase
MQTEINNALKTLRQGGIILYPTDTVWGIGCDATNCDAVKKIYALKQREEAKSMICLVNNIEMLDKYIETIPKAALTIIKQSQKPTTIIYNNPKRVAKNLVANDNTLAIRVVNNTFCNELIKNLKKPLVSTSANISEQSTPNSFTEISEHILKGVDYIVNLPDEKNEAKPSSIIKLENDGNITFIRK